MIGKVSKKPSSFGERMENNLNMGYEHNKHRAHEVVEGAKYKVIQ
jgi:hypothetical protein